MKFRAAIPQRIVESRVIGRLPFVIMALLVGMQPMRNPSVSNAAHASGAVVASPSTSVVHTWVANSPAAPLLNLDNIEMRADSLPQGTAGMMAESVAEDNGKVYLLGGTAPTRIHPRCSFRPTSGAMIPCSTR